MRINFLVLFFFSLLLASSLAAQTTAIPDANFEDYLETHDANGGLVVVGDDNSMGDGIANNGTVFTERISNIKSLVVNNISIDDLTGIGDFNSLETLLCIGNNLTALDVSNNSNLKTLICGSNLLTNLDLSSNMSLEELDCSNNQISVLDVSNNQSLYDLRCSNNRILALDISQNIELTSLSVSSNRLNNLSISANINLVSLYCASNQITALNISSNTYLNQLDASNNLITNLDLSAINSVTCPDPQTDPVTTCQGTSSINVSNNRLTSLIVANGFNDLITTFTSEGNPDLFCIQVDAGFTPNISWTKDEWTYYAETTCADIYTYVPDDNFEQALIDRNLDDVLDNLVLTSNINAIQTLDISNENIDDLTGIEDFVALDILNFSVNNIENINISTLTALTNLNASGNNLKNLDVTNLVGLLTLNVSNNNLEELDVSSNIDIEDLNCSNNSIQSLVLSINVDLTDFDCAFNDLQALNIQNGQNGNLANFDTTSNPDLSCILADANTIPAGVNWAIGSASLNTNCGTYVPDNGFEQAIIDAGFDVGPLDNYVPTGNIVGETNLNVNGYNITDLTGIQDFAALMTFDCSDNNIVTLDLTANLALTNITCNNNALEFVDIRNGNNTNTTVFNATNNPNLFCINVDAAVIGNIPGGWIIDPIADYNADCEANRYTPIPDDNFEQALIDLGFDSGALDNQVLTANIEYLKSLNVSGENIESLEGIQAFISLTELDCSSNFLDELDVSGMVNLESLFCGSNYFLTNNIANINGVLNTTGTASLKKLFCANNNLADLDISINPNLEELDCSNNSLTTLDISNNNSLIEANCDNNLISNFVSYTADNSTLNTLNCNNNELSTLQVSRCLALTTLNCRNNTLSLLDISANAAIEVLDFSDNELTDVNLSANINLIALSGSQNQLTEIDDLASTVLESLILNNNQINQLNTILNGLTSIKYVSVSSNELTDINASTNTNLIELNISNNAIATLQLSANLNQLKTFNCSENEVTGGLDLSTMGLMACPTRNTNNPLDFCPDTITINVSGNQLDFVNIQNGINNNISNFSATSNPNLTCIQVDDVNIIGANWTKDATAVYSLDCKFGETYVPDDNFEQALIDLGYDTGVLDDYVPTANIEMLTMLDVSGNGISDLTGIEDFMALLNLNCSNNTLSELDISNIVNLTVIDCSNNLLIDLDVTETPNVISLNISNNQITELDASLISLLQSFNCDGNAIIELDVTTNTALTNLSCASNLLEILNLQNGANASLTNLNAQSNPNLSCIQTDSGTEPAGVTWFKDATTAYAIDCHFGETYVPDDNFEQALIDLGYDVQPSDDYVPTANIENRTFLDVSGKEIADLTGIEDFENLRNLVISNNVLTGIDLSNNLLLQTLVASNNELLNLDFMVNTNLIQLNVSNNSLSVINVNSNLNLEDINVEGNMLAVLDVSALINLKVLNCSSNQLTALNVTSNPNLIILYCQANSFTQDSLNLQNGANETLTKFSATSNPDLSCILVDDPVAVISNIDGTYDEWYKDPTANYQSICDDADNDGIANEDDLCPGTIFGEPVDLFGCPYASLPVDNFTILITGETCLNNNDGKINITSKEFYEYKANLKGDDFDRNYTFTNEIDILNLLAGTYKLCITSDELPNYESCFDVVISHPENLEVITDKRQNSKEVSFNLSGSSSYIINLNGLEFRTYESELTLQLENGVNDIKISTDKDCQGVYEESILVSDKMVIHPNPFKESINIHLDDLKDKNIEISMYSYLGQLVFHKTIKDPGSSLYIETNNLSAGFYTVFVKSSQSLSTFKIVKK
ncbi:T9SS type A sorting domain-containing protein [Seonamhaeicola sp. MEBiC1930]|uniref:T9SS type A sorting domain-containing protein n=1 Tax=Seonamhaeicola sp. MEBiC01930 TaxID=2976768 RepID=UPI0032534CD4